jgi:hypothetical protein
MVQSSSDELPNSNAEEEALIASGMWIFREELPN